MFSSSYMIQRKKCWKDSASEIFFFIIIIIFFFQSFYIHFIFIYYIMITCVFGITFEFYFLLDYLCSIWNENLLSFVVFVVVVQFIMFEQKWYEMIQMLILFCFDAKVWRKKKMMVNRHYHYHHQPEARPVFVDH